MRVARTPAEVSAESPELLTLTLGNFDGLHLGHQAVLAELKASSEARRGTSVAVTFDPHPVAVVRPERAPRLLMPIEERLEALSRSGIDATLVVEFTSAIASEDAREFLAWLGVARGSHLVLGYDFQMGHDRACDLSTLSELGAELGFGLDIVPPVEHEGLPISSSRIRDALSLGDVQDAASMLGRPYSVSGEVVEGTGVGRTLGSPTANLQVAREKLVPGDGVYFATVAAMGGRPALLYVGTKPTLDGSQHVTEVHILDFDGDLYGQRLSVGVHRRLRGDARFENVEELRRRIREDVERARAISADRDAG